MRKERGQKNRPRTGKKELGQENRTRTGEKNKDRRTGLKTDW